MAVHANDLLLQRLLWRLGYIEAPVKVCDKCDDIVIRAGAAARQCTSNRLRALSTYSRCAETLLSAVNLDDINGISRLLRTVSNVNDLTETLSPLSMAARKGYVCPALPTPTSVPVCIEYKLSQLTFVLGRQRSHKHREAADRRSTVRSKLSISAMAGISILSHFCWPSTRMLTTALTPPSCSLRQRPHAGWQRAYMRRRVLGGRTAVGRHSRCVFDA
jgi:hypothetical protein